MTQLEACPHCDRHVKISESACPFCARSLVDAFANLAPRLAPRARLGRAATFAFGVSIAVTQGACTEHGKGGPPSPDASVRPDANTIPIDASPPDDALDGGDTPIYAAAPTDAGAIAPKQG
jgi:hypothetical protein